MNMSIIFITIFLVHYEKFQTYKKCLTEQPEQKALRILPEQEYNCLNPRFPRHSSSRDRFSFVVYPGCCLLLAIMGRSRLPAVGLDLSRLEMGATDMRCYSQPRHNLVAKKGKDALFRASKVINDLFPTIFKLCYIKFNFSSFFLCISNYTRDKSCFIRC